MIAILAVGRRLGEWLGVDAATIERIVARHGTHAVLPPPGAGALRPGEGALALGEACMVLGAAVAAMARARLPGASDKASEIAAHLNVGSDELRLALPLFTQAAAWGAPLTGADALAAYFEPDLRVKTMAKALVSRLELRRKRHSIAHVRPADYEHALDRAALQSVRSVTGMETALRKLSELGVEKVEAIENLAGCVRVGPAQFPELYALFCDAVEMLGMPRMPELYMKAMGVNAYTMGIESPRVVLSYSLPSLLTRDELLFVIGHELGHIRSGHAPFAMLRHFLPQLVELIGQATLGIGALIGMGMQAALLDWYRKSELTCDRCGLLVCQDSDAALSALMKLAGAPIAYYRQLNLDAFIAQADDYDKLDASVLSKLYKLGNALENDHPWPVVRARELVRWIRAGDYDRLVAGSPSNAAPVCNGCRSPIQTDDVFCSTCGTRVTPTGEAGVPR